jgi:tetratricopeptide (TPR) repeat protein
MADLVRQYHRLLKGDETIENFDASLRLVEDLVGARIRWQREELELKRLEDEQRNFDQFFARLNEAAQQFQIRKVAEAAEGRRRTKARIQQQARVVKGAFALSTFPDLIEQLPTPFTSDRVSFVLDACVLLFHQAYFALLPALNASGWNAERLLLLEAFRGFAHHCPRPSDAFGVLALYYDALGESDVAARHYADAVAATHSDSHEFMSVLQTAWTFCIERHRYREALDVLLGVNSRVSRSDMSELHEMVTLTFDLMRSYYESPHRSAG